jgi:hypothetical protein
MSSTGRIYEQPLSDLVAPSAPDVDLRAPAKVAGERRGRDWLSAGWTALFAGYAAAVVPLLGWAIVQAL